MLGILVFAVFVLLTCAGPPVNGYTLGTLSGGRGQEYSSGYRTGSFGGAKGTQADYAESGASHGYPVISGGPRYSESTGGSYDSGYADGSIVTSDQANGYGSANTQGNALSASSYSSDLGGGQTAASELVGASYSTGGSSSGIAYSTSGISDGRVSHVTSGPVDYPESPLIAGSGNNGGGLSGVERGEYSSSPVSSSPYASYAIGAPKASAYSSSSRLVTPGNPAALSSGVMGSYSSGSSFSPAHRPSHPSSSSGLSYAASGMSLKGFPGTIHGSNAPNYAGYGSSHRGSPGHHLYAAASNPSTGYTPRGPGYFSGNSPYTRVNAGPGGKIFLVKEGSAAQHPGHAYPGDHQGAYSGSNYASPGNGYKVRNIASPSGHSTSFANGYSSPGTYTGVNSLASSHPGNKYAGGFFSFF